MSSEKPVVKIAFAISSRPERPARENPIYRGAEIAMDTLRTDASLPVRVDWEVFDDLGNPETSRTFAKRIVADPSVIGVVGPMGSAEALAMAPVFHEAGLVQISPCASHPSLCRQGFRTFFRLVANEEIQGRELARVARGYLQARHTAMVHADDAWGSALSAIFVGEYEKLGGAIVERQSYRSGTEDFAETIRAVADAHPDLVFLAVHPREGPSISGGLRNAGLSVPFLGTDAMKTSFPLGGGEPGAEAYHSHSGADFRRLPAAAAFRATYSARFPEDSTYSPEAYDAMMIIAEAARRADALDRAALLGQVQKLRDFPGVSGPISFDPTGERIGAPISFYRVRKTASGRDMEYLGIASELLASSGSQVGGRIK